MIFHRSLDVGFFDVSLYVEYTVKLRITNHVMLAGYMMNDYRRCDI